MPTPTPTPGGGGGTSTGTITIIKVVVGGTLGVNDFDLFLGGEGADSGVTYTRQVGTYVVSEIPVQDYTGTFSNDCDSNGVVQLGASQALTCTLTNTYTGTASPSPSPTPTPAPAPGGGGGANPTPTPTPEPTPTPQVAGESTTGGSTNSKNFEVFEDEPTTTPAPTETPAGVDSNLLTAQIGQGELSCKNSWWLYLVLLVIVIVYFLITRRTTSLIAVVALVILLYLNSCGLWYLPLLILIAGAAYYWLFRPSEKGKK